MEAETTSSHVNGDNGEKAEKVELLPVENAKDVVTEHVSGSDTAGRPNGTSDTIKATSRSNSPDVSAAKPEGNSSSGTRPSKNVREGQKWNNRPRRYDNNNGDRPKYKKGIKSDLTSQEESSDPVAIRKQVEFYFSDSNLLQDKFLFTKVEGHENLPVPISLIHSFKRMRHFQPLSAIIDALKESTSLVIVKDDTCIQRKTPLPEGLVGKPMVEIQKVHEDSTMARSIYAKGFGDEEPSTQFEIEAFFASHGPTNSVRLRRTYDQTFKGSVFVEFDSEETQNAFLALDPKPKWRGEELQIKSKKQYCDDKVDDIRAGKVRANGQDDRGDRHYKHPSKRRRDSPDYEQGRKDDDKDDRDWRVRRDEDCKSGFKDRNGGKHRGFGSSGRGRGRRNDRDRDRKDERGVPKIRAATPDSGNEGGAEKDTSPAQKSEDHASIKSNNDISKSEKADDKAADTGKESAPTDMDATADTTTTTSNTKKRAREEDGLPEGEIAPKKVDTKETEA